MSATQGIDQDELHFVRYFVALKTGRIVMVQVFQWGYQGGYPIRDYLLSQPGYSDKKFETDFGHDQKQRLASSTPLDVKDFDITLLYNLMQLTCGLAHSTDPVWTKPGPTLENHLYRLKQLRNNVIHEEQRLSKLSLETKLSDLHQLLEHMYQHAALLYGKNHLLSQLSTELCQKFVSIKAKIREPLQLADLIELDKLQQEIQIFDGQILLKVKQMGVQELHERCRLVYMIDPVPWLRLGINYEPSLAFTELQIQEDNAICGEQSSQARGVKCEEILSVTRRDGTIPDVIIMTGEEGTGKTTLLKYLTEKWVCDQGAVHDLDQVDILLYTHCAQSHTHSLDHLLKHLLDKTLEASCVNLEFFRDTVLKLKTVILIDGYDKANNDSEILLKNILQMCGDARVIVTTRPGSKDNLFHLIPPGKRQLHLIVKGIAPELHSQYVDNMIDILVDDVNKRANIKECIDAKLKDLKITLGNRLNNPLKLTLLPLLWVECPQKFNMSTSVTEMSDEIESLHIENW